MAAFNIGDLVKVKGLKNSPEMVVVSDPIVADRNCCFWLNDDGGAETYDFPDEVLIKIEKSDNRKSQHTSKKEPK